MALFQNESKHLNLTTKTLFNDHS